MVGASVGHDVGRWQEVELKWNKVDKLQYNPRVHLLGKFKSRLGWLVPSSGLTTRRKVQGGWYGAVWFGGRLLPRDPVTDKRMKVDGWELTIHTIKRQYRKHKGKKLNTYVFKEKGQEHHHWKFNFYLCLFVCFSLYQWSAIDVYHCKSMQLNGLSNEIKINMMNWGVKNRTVMRDGEFEDLDQPKPQWFIFHL